MRLGIPFLLISLLGGCAKYEFDLTEPADLSRHIGRDAQTVLNRDELEYRFQSVENRLVMWVVNSTDDQIEVIGQESTVVDPGGQSHPLRSQAIAPHSYIKLILPPLRPYYRTGPTFGIGIGVHAEDDHHHGYWGPGFDDSPWDQPRYFAVMDETETYFWSWEDEGEARVRLTFRRGKEIFHHNFVFKRKKV